MRLSYHRGPWPVWSMLGAALALLTVSLAGPGTIEGGRLVRMGRGAQRLEAADGIPHSHEQDEPDPAPSGLVVGRFSQTGLARQAQALGVVQAAPPGQAPARHLWRSGTTTRGSTSPVVWPIHTPALAGAPPGPGLRLTHPDLRPFSTRPVRPALGRAPPAA